MKLVFKVINRYKWWLIALAVSTIGVYVYLQRQASDQAAITTVTPKTRDLQETLSVSGRINAAEQATLTFPTLSRLSWVGVKEGETVNQWQAIASVDTRTLQKQLQTDLNNFAKQFITHDETLAEHEFYHNPNIDLELKRILEKAQYDLDNAVITVEIRDLAIRLSTITSPIAGIVTHIDKPHAGVTIGPTDTFQVVNPTTIYFEVIIDEEDIGLVDVDQLANITLDAFPSESFNSSVTFIDFSPSPTDGGGTGYLVKLALPVDNLSLKYKLGMNGEADIILREEAGVLSIPVDGLITRDNQTFVEVLKDGQVERVKVETGVAADRYIQITSGLAPDDLVVIPDGN
jgi:RND family efflux transporter MFP subunit